MKPPTGIPKSMLMQTPDGSYALPSGAGAVLKPNELVQNFVEFLL
jgi:E3 ubiquitin-protein ligase RBBP6